MNLFPALAVCAACVLMSPRAEATITKINITGVVLPETCDIDADNLNQRIDLGEYSVTDFQKVGSVTKNAPFSLAMTNCSSGITSAKIRFTGSTLNDGLFSMGGGGLVGLELLNGSNAQIRPGVTNTFKLQGGDNTLAFSLRLRSLRAPVTPSELSATLTMDIEYE